MKLTKRMKAIREGFDKDASFTLEEAIKMLKDTSKVKFDETVDIAIKLGVDPKQSDQNVRGMVSLPHGNGKTCKVIVFARGAKAEEAKAAGADVVGDDDLIEKINGGWLDFDRCVATPDMMGIIGKVAKVLGPKGLMPNPKLGTVTMDVTKAVKEAKSGSIEFRVDKASHIYAGVAKLSFDAAKIATNIKALIDAVNKAKPASSKGVYLQKVTLSSTMGLGVKVNLSSFA
jgi:large subunit ribosomal protein L1